MGVVEVSSSFVRIVEGSAPSIRDQEQAAVTRLSLQQARCQYFYWLWK
jgi:hypothetical protein